MKKINIQNNYKQVVKDILLELYEEEFVAEINSNINQFVSKDIFSTNDLLEENDNKQIIIFCKQPLDKNSKLSINNLITNEDSEYRIYFLLESIEEIVKTKNIIKTEWKSNFPKIRRSKVIIRYIQFSKESEKEFPIEIQSCLNRLEYKNDNNDKGNVYTAKLLDIIEIYNFIGNALFDKNVRYKISDTLDVEEKIRETLEKDPASFWFYNNGVAMLAQNNGLDEEEELKITYKYSKFNQIQIINGAQTITCAAEYYYEIKQNVEKLKLDLFTETDEGKKSQLRKSFEEYKKILENFNKAYIVLRIIYNNNTSPEFINNVSLSLNRQKPIKNYDLKFMTPEVQIINSLYEDNDKHCPYFYILKSGELSDNETCCDLITFMKIYAICELQKPGTARNGKGSLLSDSYWNELKRKDDEQGDEQYFEKHFKYFYLAKKIYILIEKVFKEINENKEEILLYSKEFLTAYIIFIIKEQYDSKIKLDNYPSLIENKMKEIANQWVTELKKIEGNKYDSNFFKKDSSYDNVKKNLQKEKDFSKLIFSILKLEEK